MTQEELTYRIRRGDSFLVAGDGEFIGRLSTNIYDSESISNRYGVYGSIYGSKSIWNQYGRYGSQYSLVSPNNPYSLNTPTIYLRGVQVAYLTCNINKLGQKINPSDLQTWMIKNNL